jgi:hypothetical protein
MEKQIKSSQIIYSEHDYDECFEYKDGSGRVPDGTAIGYLKEFSSPNSIIKDLFLFEDVIYSHYDHQYWDNYELEHDEDRVVLP